MEVSLSLLAGCSRVSTVPAGRRAKASLVGAKTVKGPAPSSVSTRPAAFTAATRVVWSLEWTAFSIMFLLGYMGAPPTVVVISACAGATNVGAAMATLAARRRKAEFSRSWVVSVGFRHRSPRKHEPIGTCWLRGAPLGVAGGPPKKRKTKISLAPRNDCALSSYR